MAARYSTTGPPAYGVMARSWGRRGRRRADLGRPPAPRARALCLAAIGWGIAILAAAAAPSLTLELTALVFVGYGSITFNSLAKTTLQLAANRRCAAG